ncbi:hypothetical protein GUJ93_ZPchr0001g31121 [Zizania palustris]|uniref:Uncharacterized protein n=1 Tax=Zizania palustris TaxID=103762 RepID=A0A8J5RN75_ZIZPA|nr:hypothetical protein GUJ93_ZPchr0001g31121 [Zizania palustris]
MSLPSAVLTCGLLHRAAPHQERFHQDLAGSIVRLLALFVPPCRMLRLRRLQRRRSLCFQKNMMNNAMAAGGRRKR